MTVGAALDTAALVTTAAGLVAAVVVLAVTGAPRQALPVLLEFLTAAGVLRLAGSPAWTDVATAGAVIAVRHLVTSGLQDRPPKR